MGDDVGLVMFCPTRERPGQAQRLAKQFLATTATTSWLSLVVDADDPVLDSYREVVDALRSDRVCLMVAPVTSRAGCMQPTNWAVADLLAEGPPVAAIGFMGDDHWPVTVGWDSLMMAELDSLGIGLVYGNDLHMGERLPTAVVMSANIPRALGYLAPPTFRHLFVDDYWLRLGRDAAAIRYLPDVVLEHRHPFAGKAKLDTGYERVNAPLMGALDKGALWGHIQTGAMARDVATVVSLRADAAREATCST